MEIPFDAKEVFQMPKGTIFVCGVINDIPYRGKLLSRGNGKQVLTIDKPFADRPDGCRGINHLNTTDVCKSIRSRSYPSSTSS